jgi:hypothetical protein
MTSSCEHCNKCLGCLYDRKYDHVKGLRFPKENSAPSDMFVHCVE